MRVQTWLGLTPTFFPFVEIRGTHKALFQWQFSKQQHHHPAKSSFFNLQHSHLYIVKSNITVWVLLTLISSTTCLYLRIFSDFFIAALPICRLLQIPWLQSLDWWFSQWLGGGGRNSFDFFPVLLKICNSSAEVIFVTIIFNCNPSFALSS